MLIETGQQQTGEFGVTTGSKETNGSETKGLFSVISWGMGEMLFKI